MYFHFVLTEKKINFETASMKELIDCADFTDSCYTVVLSETCFLKPPVTSYNPGFSRAASIYNFPQNPPYSF
jgi:hypothetical protein